MTKIKDADNHLLGTLFARTAPEDEVQPQGWQDLIKQVADLASSANALICICGDEGTGKTTFLRQLSDKIGRAHV